MTARGSILSAALLACSHLSPDMQSFSPAGNGAISGTEDGSTAVAKIDHDDGDSLRRNHAAPMPDRFR